MITRCIYLHGDDVYFNLAAEEYFLKNSDNDIFMIWQSKNAVVVGKHQNSLAEINQSFIRQNNINIARRLSGGGAVFHDRGNLNYTFICKKGSELNLKQFTDRMISILSKLGLSPTQDERRAIFLDEKKISGCADHIYKDKVLHHGTLLFDSNLEYLKNALNVDSHYNDKSVQSVRNQVTNIKKYIPGLLIQEFAEFVFHENINRFHSAEISGIEEKEVNAINKLKEEKYTQWDWVYGYSPKYLYSNTITLPDKVISFSLNVKKGRISSSEWEGLSPEARTIISEKLRGQKHDYDELMPFVFSISDMLVNEGLNVGLLLEKLI